MPECAKTHLQQYRISKFSGEDPRTPFSRGGEGREGRRGRGKGREGGRGGKARSTWAPPPRDKLWIRPCSLTHCVTIYIHWRRTRDKYTEHARSDGDFDTRPPDVLSVVFIQYSL